LIQPGPAFSRLLPIGPRAEGVSALRFLFYANFLKGLRATLSILRKLSEGAPRYAFYSTQTF